MPNITHQALLSPKEINYLIQQAGLYSQSAKQKQQLSHTGEYSAERFGTGLDFADRRLYQVGDDPRFIDWRASARSSQTLVRRYYAEQDKPNCLLIDRHSSMLFGTKTRLKLTQALRYGVFTGAQIIHSGQQLACYIAQQQPYWQSASERLHEFTQSMQYAARAYPPDFQLQPTNWSLISEFLLRKLPRGSRLIVVSDFHSVSDKGTLAALANSFDLHLVCISDEAEHVALPQFVDLYAPQRASVRSNEHIQHAIEQFQQQLKQRLSRLNAQVRYLKTNDQLGLADES